MGRGARQRYPIQMPEPTPRTEHEMKQLLVVDDEPEFSEIVRRVAAPLGYDVRAVTSGRELKLLYDELRPDTIVLDMVMPEMEGVEVLQWLSDRDCKARIIVVTGFNPHYVRMASELATVKGLGSITTLTKPVHVSDLRAELLRA